MTRALAAARSELTRPAAPFEIVEELVGGRTTRVYRQAPGTLVSVLHESERHGEATFLIFGDERVAFADHARWARRLAAELSDRWGVGKGDRVAIAMRNHPEWSVSFFAAQLLGAVAVPLNAWWTGPELAFALEDSGAIVAVVDGERLERLRGEGLDGSLRHIVVARTDRNDPEIGPGATRWAEVIDDAGTTDPTAPWAVEPEPDDPATILYTSGTTGRPKGALGTHRNHVNNLMNVALRAAALQLIGAAVRSPGQQPVTLQTFPLFHIGGLTNLYCAARAGTRLVLLNRWDPEVAVPMIESEGVTTVAGVPTVAHQLLASPALDRHDVSTVSILALGGAGTPPELLRRVERRLGARVTATNSYGLTETTSGVVMNGGPEYQSCPESAGQVVPVTDVRVVGPDGEDVAVGRPGELWFRGPTIVPGYWGMATSDAFVDGWFRTGDLGRVDEDDRVFVLDRLKDVVIRGGENIYCAEVEGVLFDHPGVVDAAVVGVPHEVLGEEVGVVVQVEPSAGVEADELRAHLSGRLAAFKVPSVMHLQHEPLPKTATGKVIKDELRASFYRAERRS